MLPLFLSLFECKWFFLPLLLLLLILFPPDFLDRLAPRQHERLPLLFLRRAQHLKCRFLGDDAPPLLHSYLLVMSAPILLLGNHLLTHRRRDHSLPEPPIFHLAAEATLSAHLLGADTPPLLPSVLPIRHPLLLSPPLIHLILRPPRQCIHLHRLLLSTGEIRVDAACVRRGAPIVIVVVGGAIVVVVLFAHLVFLLLLGGDGDLRLIGAKYLNLNTY